MPGHTPQKRKSSFKKSTKSPTTSGAKTVTRKINPAKTRSTSRRGR